MRAAGRDGAPRVEAVVPRAGLEGAPGRLAEGVRDAAPPRRRRVPRLREQVARGLLHRRREGPVRAHERAHVVRAELEHAGPDLVRAEHLPARRAGHLLLVVRAAARRLVRALGEAPRLDLARERRQGRDVALHDDGPPPGVCARERARPERLMPPRRRRQRLEPAVALLGLAPHRAQGRGRELALDVLHEVCAAFALPSRCLCAALLQPCAAPRRACCVLAAGSCCLKPRPGWAPRRLYCAWRQPICWPTTSCEVFATPRRHTASSGRLATRSAIIAVDLSAYTLGRPIEL